MAADGFISLFKTVGCGVYNLGIRNAFLQARATRGITLPIIQNIVNETLREEYKLIRKNEEEFKKKLIGLKEMMDDKEIDFSEKNQQKDKEITKLKEQNKNIEREGTKKAEERVNQIETKHQKEINNLTTDLTKKKEEAEEKARTEKEKLAREKEELNEQLKNFHNKEKE
jgi:membrane protein involved in colicin uptake